jgi:diadenosine tetraphosphate (Ap4A) HIT family hydrolase
MEKKDNCRFCNIGIDDNQFGYFERYGRSILHKFPILESDNFQVKPDILPVNPDGRHFLVFPKEHFYNFAQFGGNPLIVDELGRLVYQLEQQFGPLVIFEHGGVKEGNNNQSIYHAHFHAIGGLEDYDIISYMRDMVSGGLGEGEVYPYQIFPAPNYDFLSNLHHRFNGHPYLYVEQGPWALYIEDPLEQMNSQVTQRAMHKFFSGQILNWKEIPENEEFARESVRRLANIVDWCLGGEYNSHRF